MKTTIQIEQFDNGYTFRESSEDIDPTATVVLDSSAERKLGESLLADIKSVMDGNLVNIVEVEINIKPIQL